MSKRTDDALHGSNTINFAFCNNLLLFIHNLNWNRTIICMARVAVEIESTEKEYNYFYDF